MTTTAPRGPYPRKKPRKLSLAQKIAFGSPINQPRIIDRVVPVGDRMGVKANG